MELYQVLSLVISSTALIISLLNSLYIYKKTRSLAMYSDIDKLYLELLKLGIEHPTFVDPKYTHDFINKFEGEERTRYELYAFIAWNICETIFDRKDEDDLTFSSWKPVLEFETTLHREWFKENPDKFKDEFKEFIKDEQLSRPSDNVISR